MTCKICGNATGNHSFTAKEMMFGFRDEFTYLECKDCGCLQLTDIPANLDTYYPPHYYSLEPGKTKGTEFREKLMARLEKK